MTSPCLIRGLLRMGTADGGGDERVGSYWGGGCHSTMELPTDASLLEGKT